MKKKGEIEWLYLEQITEDEAHKGVQVGVKHVGPKPARRWAYASMRLQLEEAKRLADLRKGHSKETAPELFDPSLTTPEGIEAMLEMTDGAFAEAVAGLKGVEGVDVNDSKAACEWLDYLNLDERLQLMKAVTEQQQLSGPQFPVAAGPGDVPGNADAESA